MTLRECISRVDGMFQNGISEETKVKWLSELDGRIYCEVIKTHEGAPASFAEYKASEASETVLLASDPYSCLYIYYLLAMTEKALGDTERARADMSLYGEAYERFVSVYNTENMPLCRVKSIKI